MSSRTATSCTSASTSDPRGRVRIAATLGAVLLAGCTAVPQLAAPKATVVAVRLDRVTATEARFAVLVDLANPNDREIAVDAIEAEIAQLDEADRLAFLEELGLHEAGLDRVIRAAYHLLGLLTFFTVGPKEARAWTSHIGAFAPQAAGEIHTDFEKGFIRAEVISYDDFIACKGEQGAKEAGKMRLEGKEYVVREGDVMHFRFNV